MKVNVRENQSAVKPLNNEVAKRAVSDAARKAMLTNMANIFSAMVCVIYVAASAFASILIYKTLFTYSGVLSIMDNPYFIVTDKVKIAVSAVVAAVLFVFHMMSNTHIAFSRGNNNEIAASLTIYGFLIFAVTIATHFFALPFLSVLSLVSFAWLVLDSVTDFG